jgi:uncharacterized protein (DUF427 family)
MPMKVPGPDHPISISPAGKHIRVTAGDVVVADTTNALMLKEATYPEVFYIPRADTDMSVLARTARTTHCPFKGDANYYTINADTTLDNAIWTYEAPFPSVAEIKDHLAFYPDKVKIEILPV